jgi:hypothetical protein
MCAARPSRPGKRANLLTPYLLSVLLNSERMPHRQNDLIHILRLERLIGIGMDREQTALGGDAPGEMLRNELADLPVLERVGMPVHVDVRFIAVGIDDRVAVVVLVHGKVAGHQGIVRPVQQAGGQAVLLAERQPVPVGGGREIQVLEGALLEQAQDLLLVLLPRAGPNREAPPARSWGSAGTPPISCPGRPPSGRCTAR